MSTDIKSIHLSTKALLIDAILLTLACVAPAVSHMFALPLYKFNPMLLMLLVGMTLVSCKWNAYLMAVAMPLLSCAIVGMPPLSLALLMAVEMTTVVFFYVWISRYTSKFLAMMSAMIWGRVFYYILKAAILKPTVLASTPLWLQFAVGAVYAAAFALACTKLEKKRKQ